VRLYGIEWPMVGQLRVSGRLGDLMLGGAAAAETGSLPLVHVPLVELLRRYFVVDPERSFGFAESGPTPVKTMTAKTILHI
jgi:hypothetical protein